jgi:hypothetical protein
MKREAYRRQGGDFFPLNRHWERDVNLSTGSLVVGLRAIRVVWMRQGHLKD